MKITKQSSSLQIDVGVPHLPNGNGPAYKIGLDPIIVVLVIQGGSATDVRHRLEHGTLDASVGQVLFKLTVDQDA